MKIPQGLSDTHVMENIQILAMEQQAIKNTSYHGTEQVYAQWDRINVSIMGQYQHEVSLRPTFYTVNT